MPYGLGYDPVSRSIQGLTQNVRNIGDDRYRQMMGQAEMGLRVAQANRQMDDYERFKLPGLERQRMEQQEQWAADDEPFTVIPNGIGGPRSDLVVLGLKDQKVGEPMFAELNKTVQSRGVTFDPSTLTFRDKAGNPITKRQIKTQYKWIPDEVRRITGIYRDPEKALEADRAYMETALEMNRGKLTGDQASQIEAKLKRTANLSTQDRISMYEGYLDNLYATMIEDAREGRDTSYIDYQINRVEKKLGGYWDGLKESDKRAYDMLNEKFKHDLGMQKQEREYQLKGQLERDKDARAASRGGDKDGRGTFQKDVEFYSQVTGMPVAEAAELFRIDKTRGERLKMASEEISAYEMDLISMDPEEKREFIADIYRRYELLPGAKPVTREAPSQENDPLGIR